MVFTLSHGIYMMLFPIGNALNSCSFQNAGKLAMRYHESPVDEKNQSHL